jgi:hypothetical protein
VANTVNHAEDLSFNEELLETNDYSMETQRARKPECTASRATSGLHATEAPDISCMGHLSATTRAAASHHSQTTCIAVNRQHTAPGNAYPEDSEGNEMCFSLRNRSTCGIDSCQRRLGIARNSDSASAVLDSYGSLTSTGHPGQVIGSGNNCRQADEASRAANKAELGAARSRPLHYTTTCSITDIQWGWQREPVPVATEESYPVLWVGK